MVTVNATLALSYADHDISIYNEIDAIKREILTRSKLGFINASIQNNTLMTISSPIITLIATAVNPSVLMNQTLIINNDTIALGSSGLNLNSIISDINDSNLPGIIASKENNRLVIKYTPSPASWQLTLGAGSANINIGLTPAIYPATNPDSVLYHNVWRGFVTDRLVKERMDRVISAIQSKGFTIIRKTNPQTEKTFEWFIQW